MSRNLVTLVQSYREIERAYGPFRFGIQSDELSILDKAFVWSLTEIEDGGFGQTALVSYVVPIEEAFDYALASRPHDNLSKPEVAIEVIWFLCDSCKGGDLFDPDDCEECKGIGTVYIDIEEAAKELGDEVTEEEIWARRRSD